MRKRRRVAFFNPIFAHYRSALVRELCASKDHYFWWFADPQDRFCNIPVVAMDSDSHFVPCRSVKLCALTWQHGTIKPVLCGAFDAYIFEGDAKHLSSWAGAIIARLRGKRVLFFTHGWTRIDTGLKRLVRLTFYRLAHGLLLYGNRAKTIGSGFGLRPDSLYVMFNSLDADLQLRLLGAIKPDETIARRLELFGCSDAPIVIAAARLHHRKRFDLLIRALGLLQPTRRIDLILVGDGPALDDLKALASRERVKVAFVGSCYDETRLAQLFSCATVTVSPGEIGLTCMHSLGYGVPVITHDDPDSQMPEWEAVIPGLTGETFAKGEVESLAVAIERWTRFAAVPEETRAACLARVNQHYHARVQARTIEDAIRGLPAPGIEALEPAGA